MYKLEMALTAWQTEIAGERLTSAGDAEIAGEAEIAKENEIAGEDEIARE